VKQRLLAKRFDQNTVGVMHRRTSASRRIGDIMQNTEQQMARGGRGT